MASSIPSISISVPDGVDSITKGTYSAATMTIVDSNTGETLYSGGLKIKGHGNYTWSLPKKPYKIKLDKKASILGMAKHKDFLLMANGVDPSLVNTALALSSGQKLSALTWTPHFAFADVYFNDVYWGNYLVTETIELDSSRLDLPEVDDSKHGKTGTYYMEINNQGNQDNPSITSRVSQMHILFDDPDGSDEDQKKYMQDFMDSFDTLLFPTGVDGAPPDTEYQSKVNMPSFAAWYLLEDFASNQDSQFFGSCKMYKTKDAHGAPGVLHMGPLWDFDLSFGNYLGKVFPADQTYTTASAVFHPADQNYTIPGAIWISQMLRDDAFLAVVKQQWQFMTGKEGPIGPNGANLLQYMNEMLDMIGKSHQRDQERWGYTYAADNGWSHLPNGYATRDDWVKQRCAFFDRLYGS